MSDLPRKVEHALRQVAVPWTEERSERLRARVQASVRRRGVRTTVGAVAAVFAAVLFVGVATAGVQRLVHVWRPVATLSVGAPAPTMGAVEPRRRTAPEEAPAAALAEEPKDDVQPVDTRVAVPSSAPIPLAATASVWRTKAQEGDFDSAYRALQSVGPAAVRDEAGDLLLEADVARLSHHPLQALAPLERTVREHPSDPRAPLAAFTLGRVLLDELGRPAEAAGAFAQAQELGAGGPLEEDALAREVEAASRAGDSTRARAAAERYVTRYPSGRRLRSVRRFGGLD